MGDNEADDAAQWSTKYERPNGTATTYEQEGAPSEIVVEVVLDELRKVLFERNSSLSNRFSLDAGLEAQTRSILEEVFAEIGRQNLGQDSGPITVDYGSPSSLAAHGQNAAVRDVDPAEPLMAAEVIFDVALPVIVRQQYQLNDKVDPIFVARTLHHAIWRRFPPGAIAYVNVLRTRLAASYSEGRLRLAREVHDRHVHGIAAGIQRIELSSSSTDGLERQQLLTDALTTLRATMSEMQNLAADLRQFVGNRGLDEALAAHIRSQHGTPTLRFVANDRERMLPTTVKEEAFAIALEAIRNARAHAEAATEISVVSEWSGDTLTLEVSDDGTRRETPSGEHVRLGLIGMTERAHTIGARLSIIAREPGTTVRLEVPFSESDRP